MKKYLASASLRRTSALFQAAVLAASAFVPALLLSGSASGAQLGARFIDMSATQTSEGSGRDGGDAFGQDVTYSVSFVTTTTVTNMEGIVIEFCSNTPIIDTACTAPTGFNTNFATLAFTDGDTDLNANWAVDTTNSTANKVVLTDDTTTGDNIAAATTIEFDLGTAAAADGFTNPTVAGSFYARIVTYDDDLEAVGYTSLDADVVGAHFDDGGIALAVANELTVTARVQEVLQFCVGTETDSSLIDAGSDDCTLVAGTALDLGVVDSNSIQRTSDGDILNDGIFLVRTNGLSGAVVYYKAEQETGLSNGGAGTLRQAGVDDCGTIGSVANGCFNSAGGDITNPTQAAITLGTELFGMTLTNLDTTSGGATAALSCDADYDGDGSCTGGAATGYAWDPTGAFDTIASSSGPIDDEKVRVEFAATASPTTPTGLYTATANFVATATF